MADYHEGSGYDPETVRFFDVAHEGAQIRAVTGAVDKLAGLRGNIPRSVVVIATDYVARAAANFEVERRSPLRAPVVVTDSLPVFVGALDVVIVVGDKADDPDAAQALITASRRGAVTVLAGPAEGPILSDAPDDCIVIPALPTATGVSPARTITALAATIDLIEEEQELVTARLEELADAVDEEAAALSPEREELVNAGRQLRSFVDGARVLHTGGDRMGMAVAEVVAAVWNSRGLASGVIAAEEVAHVVHNEPPAVDDIFHDPFLDEPSSVLPLKIVVWAADESGMPNALAVNTPASGLGAVGQSLRLITRGLAATVYEV